MWVHLFLALAVLLFAYPFAIYPLVLRIVSRARRAPAEFPDEWEPPSVALVICALNERKTIRQKIENSLALEYPKEKLRIVVVSDGSTDGTADIAREYVGRGIELIERERRRGKVSNINDVVSMRTEDIIALSDANVIYGAQALIHLTQRFRDAAVGCVSGKVVLVGTTESLKASEENYYSIEWALQDGASRLYSMAGADGAMHAFRRALFRPSPADTLIEDFVMPMAIVRQGYRVVFEPKAVGWESGVVSLSEEFRRKTRIAAGAAQALLRGNGWPVGTSPVFWFIFVSHKLLRWLSPFVGLLILGLAVATLPSGIGILVLGVTLALSAAAALRLVTGKGTPPLDGPFYFLFGQVALIWGLLKGAAGKQSVLWAKADR